MANQKVTVLLPTLLASCAHGKREVKVEATTLEECVDELITQYPLLEVHLFEEGRRLRPNVNVFYNKESLKQIANWRFSLGPGDTLTILQAVSGG